MKTFIYHFIKWKEMFYLMMHSIYFLYVYMASYVWSRTIQIAKWNPLPLPCKQQSIFYMHNPRHDSTYHNLIYTSSTAMAGRNSSMGPPWGIDIMTHHTANAHYQRATSGYFCKGRQSVESWPLSAVVSIWLAVHLFLSQRACNENACHITQI